MGRGGFRAGGGARLHRRRPGTCRRGGRALRGPSRARYARCTPRPRVGWGAVRIIEQIGSYAGFAAVLGLAVLSALYFSQARDVRRLRDWAGRAPERDAEARARVAAATPAGQQRQAASAQPAAAEDAGAAQPATTNAGAAQPAATNAAAATAANANSGNAGAAATPSKAPALTAAAAGSTPVSATGGTAGAVKPRTG